MTKLVKTTRNFRGLYTALEDLNFIWNEERLPDVHYLWTEGTNIKDMAKYFKRKPIEVFLIVLDQIECGKLQGREGGIHGFQLTDN